MTATGRRVDIAEKTLAFVFFSTLFLTLTMPVFDPDFWWHLASGRWMWENASLMREDPFTFTGFAPDAETKAAFALKEYWLSQLIFYGIYSLLGFKGLIVLRASALTLMFYALYRLMRSEGAGPALSALMVYVAAVVIVKEFGYVGIRPQMWTSLFAVVLIYVLESMKRQERWTYAALPALMLLWANMHGGFILGDVIIAIYMLVAAAFRTGSRPFYLCGGGALLISGLNPAGYSAFLFVLMSAFIDSEYVRYWKTVVESQSIFRHASLTGIIKSLPFFSGLCMASLASVALNIRQARHMKKELLLLYGLVFYMGVNSIRYIVFFAPVASLITAMNIRGLMDRFSVPGRFSVLGRFAGAGARALVASAAALVVLLSADMALEGARRTAFKYERPYGSDYAGAADFIRQNRLGGNVFADYAPGGYLIWRLWPESRVFIYGRVLSARGFDLFRRVVDDPYAPAYPPYDLTPLYVTVLNKYNVDLAVLPGCDKASGVTIQLSLALIKDPGWAIVYADAASLVFMRHTPENRAFIAGHVLPRTVGYDNILAMALAAMKGGHAHMMPGVKLSLAVAYNGRGEAAKALHWVNEYLRQVPRDPRALKLKRDIEAIGG